MTTPTATYKLHSWSHSALKDFEGCARRYHEVRVLKKYPFVQSEEAKYGDRLHKAAELYVKDGTPLPAEFLFIKPAVDALLKKTGRKLPEYEMALTPGLKPCGWWDKDVWVRAKADLLIVDDDGLIAWVVDWKSGSNKYPDRDQLALMSLMTFEHFPHIRKVNSALIYVVKNDMVRATMERSESVQGWWSYRARTAKLEAAFNSKVWNPTQSGLCKKWCPCTGCEFNGNH